MQRFFSMPLKRGTERKGVFSLPVLQPSRLIPLTERNSGRIFRDEARKLFEREPFEYEQRQSVPPAIERDMARFFIGKFLIHNKVSNDSLSTLSLLIRERDKQWDAEPDVAKKILALQTELPESRIVRSNLDALPKQDLQQLIRRLKNAENDITHGRMMLRQLAEADPRKQSGPALLACGHIIARGAVRAANILHSITVFVESYSKKRFPPKLF
jgi:hypothetical protein